MFICFFRAQISNFNKRFSITKRFWKCFSMILNSEPCRSRIALLITNFAGKTT